MDFREAVNFAYSLWVKDLVNFEVSPSVARNAVDDKIEEITDVFAGRDKHLRAVPDRETWGSTPEDIQSQLKMEALATKAMSKSKGKRQT